MSAKTLRQVCETLKVSRRAVQGYEKEGLVTASGRNERGWLLYDEECQEQIRRVRFYQQLGLEVKGIKAFLNTSVEYQRRILLERQEALKKEIQERKELIVQISRLLSETEQRGE
ncbi:MAG: MerR family transcriptional regulator [Lachnospiraceae bacterium]|nr:MerR family transcriptional regulator [Lachnospiraceae bacterium]